ncbi:MAG: hypothetical protein HYR85_00155 [Planctomycetes bacterium]|nr:hypothetical protein [Planctomycetota bacterium]MBI3845003.1 hypothetical protein [Planctomycetota bacterium]
MKVVLDKIGSSTLNAKLRREEEIAGHCEAKAGNVIVVRAMMEKNVYDRLELVTGRMAKINRGDVLAGALGFRRALKGFVGVVPETIHPGDTLHILNLGGVIGRCTSRNLDLGPPLEVEVLGMVVRNGKTVNIAEKALPLVDRLEQCAPLIVVAGTCMNSGKTHVASELIKRFSRNGARVAACKLTGIACLKDTLDMEDHGAFATLSFLDCGLPSTATIENVAPVAKAILSSLTEKKPDLIVVELGDGIIGGYQVPTFFEDKEILSHVKALVMCANDLVAAWGAKAIMDQRGLHISCMAGPVTDNEMGTSYIRNELGLPAANAITSGRELYGVVYEEVHR